MLTIKALSAMPGVARGSIMTVEDGEHVRKLIAAGRYQVIADTEVEATPAEVAPKNVKATKAEPTDEPAAKAEPAK
jgi:cephalosporin hydroxylase